MQPATLPIDKHVRGLGVCVYFSHEGGFSLRGGGVGMLRFSDFYPRACLCYLKIMYHVFSLYTEPHTSLQSVSIFSGKCINDNCNEVISVIF